MIRLFLLPFLYCRFQILGALSSISSALGGGGLAGVIGGAFGLGGSIYQGNQSVASAKDQMQFQREMSNTAHRREVKDLKAAGLNPILSAKYGGASTPQGAGYQIPNIGAAATTGAHNASSAATQTAQYRNMLEQNNILAKEAKIAGIEADFLERFPEIALGRLLKDVNPVNMGIVGLLMRRAKGLAGPSAKAIEKGSKSGNTRKPFTIDIPYKSKSAPKPSTKGLTREQRANVLKKHYQKQMQGMTLEQKRAFLKKKLKYHFPKEYK